MIIVKNLKKPGVTYDSSKLAILGNRVSGSIEQKTRGNYIVSSKISGNTLKLTIKKLNPETGRYSFPDKNEQTLLAGRIASFLHQSGVAGEVEVR